ncbi:MAG TPA: hypothetical protein VF173_17710 [Thermoanaerobaculia bacterium]|nr:hypothetical protein [Thermoanaerobaculia bacterium]
MRRFNLYERPVLGLEALKVGFSWPLFFSILWMFARKLWSYSGLWLGLYAALLIMVGELASATPKETTPPQKPLDQEPPQAGA